MLDYLAEELENEKQRADTVQMYLAGETQLMSNIGAADQKGFGAYQKHRARLIKRMREIDQAPEEKPKTVWERLRKRK